MVRPQRRNRLPFPFAFPCCICLASLIFACNLNLNPNLNSCSNLDPYHRCLPTRLRIWSRVAAINHRHRIRFFHLFFISLPIFLVDLFSPFSLQLTADPSSRLSNRPSTFTVIHLIDIAHTLPSANHQQPYLTNRIASCRIAPHPPLEFPDSGPESATASSHQPHLFHLAALR